MTVHIVTAGGAILGVFEAEDQANQVLEDYFAMAGHRKGEVKTYTTPWQADWLMRVAA